jgi:hypothetical protein
MGGRLPARVLRGTEERAVIELQMVGRMARRAVLFSPVLIGALWLWRGFDYGLSGAVGVAMTLLNLWLAARIIGGVADNHPQLLLPAGLGAFVLGLLLLTAIAFALRNVDVLYFPVTGFVLIGSHLGLVLWEAAGAYPKSHELAKSRG